MQEDARMLSILRTKRRKVVCFVILLFAILVTFAVENSRKCAQSVISYNGLTVDYSHSNEGYIVTKTDINDGKLKIRVSKGDVTYTYDHNITGAEEVLPLQMGNGTYTVSLYKNIVGSRYTRISEVHVKAQMEDEKCVFLCPSQYVNYTQESPAVKKSMELCQGLNSDREKVEAIRSYLRKSLVYDYVRAITISKNYLGDIDGCFETRMGLCLDIAALTACMLRVQGIPTQLAIGYVGDYYHAWNQVLLDGEYIIIDITAEMSVVSGDEYIAERIY